MLWVILPKTFKIRGLFILILTIIGAVFEMLSIGLIVPALTLMINKNLDYDFMFFEELNFYLKSLSHETLLIYGIMGLLLVFLIKNFYLAIIYWKQFQYSFDLKANLSERIFQKYIYADYEFHIQNNSSHLIRNVAKEMQLFVQNVIIPIVRLLTEIIVISAIVFLLIFMEPIGAVFLFIFTLFAIFIFQFLTKSILQKWGERRQYHEGFLIQKIQEGLSGAKEAKILGREEGFIQQFSFHNLNLASNERKHMAMLNMPPLWLETVGVSGILLMVFLLLSNYKIPTEIIPTLGLFAAAGFKLMPSASRILNSIQSIRYSKSIIELVEREIKVFSKLKKDYYPIEFKNKISVKDVSYAYPNSEKRIIKNISFEINKGKSLGIIGESGSGKTTIINLILGILKPSSGSIFVDKIDIQNNLRGWQNNIGYVSQSFFLIDDSLKRNIAFGINENDIDMNLIDSSIKKSKLTKLIKSLKNGIETKIGERGINLSGGQMQRIAIARAIYHNPSILIFDEATSSLDSKTEHEIIKEIQQFKNKKTIIMISHNRTTLKFCDNILDLNSI